MARQNTPLDDRVDSAIIQVCEDLSVSIEEIAQEIVKEFEESSQPASYESIVKELTEVRAIQIQENQYVDGAESAYLDRLYVEAP